MKIKNIESWSEHLDLVRPYKIATREVTDVENAFVKIELESGEIGYGSASPAENVTGESFEMCKEALATSNLEWLVGESIDEYESHCQKLLEQLTKTPAACAAVDIALHDAFAKSKNLPLVDVLGRKHFSMPTSITIGIKGVHDTLIEAAEYIERGFDVLKVKLGDDLSEDIERLVMLREVYGKQITIRVDMNQGYHLEELKKFLDQTEKLNIEFLEQPFPVSSVSDLQELSPVFRKNIALDENLISVDDAKKHINDSGIYNIKLMKCGGIYAACQIANIAQENNIDVMWGCNDESRISIAAALHVAFASKNTKYLDLDGSLDLAHDVVKGGFVIENGVMRTLEKPGLGIQE